MAEIVSVRRKRHDTLFAPGGQLSNGSIDTSDVSFRTNEPCGSLPESGINCSCGVRSSVAIGINRPFSLRYSPNIVSHFRHVDWVPRCLSVHREIFLQDSLLQVRVTDAFARYVPSYTHRFISLYLLLFIATNGIWSYTAKELDI